MKTALVLTAIGPDRPGLVEMLSDAIASFGGNWESSRMARLGGKFAGIALVTFSGGVPEGLRAALDELGGRGFAVKMDEATADTRAASVQLYDLELVGNDRPGILREVSRVLSRLEVNVEELGTTCESAPMTGGELFRLRALLATHVDFDSADLLGELESLSAELMVEIRSVDGDD